MTASITLGADCDINMKWFGTRCFEFWLIAKVCIVFGISGFIVDSAAVLTVSSKCYA